MWCSLILQSSPLLFHYVDDNMFTSAAWSLSRPDVLFVTEESGLLQMWEVAGRKSEPFQTQNISGKTLNCALKSPPRKNILIQVD